MLITKTHIDYHLDFMRELEEYKKEIIASDETSTTISTPPTNTHDWWGPLNLEQLDYIQPGFLRVEVLTDPQRPTQADPGPIPIYSRARPDPRICCHSQYIGLQGKLAPQYPTAQQLLLWETGIPGLFVRKMPVRVSQKKQKLLDWVAVLPIKGLPNKVPGYWAGTDGALAPDYMKKPQSKLNHFIGQSAGWMASAAEVMDWNDKLCKGQFLPPFDEPQLQEDGMGFMTDSVEFWSGGLQLWGQLCEVQRVVSLDPHLFSKHLLYHTANNKQKEIPQERLIPVSTVLGQLHTVQQRAEAAMYRELGRGSWIFRILRAVGLSS
jgi:hypothetical protein